MFPFATVVPSLRSLCCSCSLQIYPHVRIRTRTRESLVFIRSATGKPVTGRSKIRNQRRRAGWGTISREQVVAAAAQAVREGCSEQMTIRSLAAEALE